MTYPEAKEILHDAIGPRDQPDLITRLAASPGKPGVIDVSVGGALPDGDSYADQILRSLMVVWRYVVRNRMVDRELLGILVLMDIPIRTLAAETRHVETRLPQISLMLDVICLSSLSTDKALEQTSA